MMELVIAGLMGLSIALFVWSLRFPLAARYRRDVSNLEHAMWRLSPDPFNAKPYIAVYWAFAIITPILILLFLPLKALLIVAWLVLVVLPKIMLDKKWSNRRKLINEQLPAAVLQLSASVASGMSLVQAIERLAERAADPIRTEFRIIANYWSMGSDFTSTIEEAKRRLDLPDFTLFASAIVINQRMGGNIVKTLERLAHSLEAIDRMRREVFVATAEGRTSIKVLAVAPIIMLFFVSFMDAEAVGWLFTRPFGQVLLMIAFVLTGSGTFWAWRIVNADV